MFLTCQIHVLKFWNISSFWIKYNIMRSDGKDNLIYCALFHKSLIELNYNPKT